MPFLLFFLLPDDFFGVDDLDRDLEARLLLFLDFLPPFPSLLLSTVPASLPSLSSWLSGLDDDGGEGDDSLLL